MKLQKKVAYHASELHRNAIVIDCHCDILVPVADGFIRLGRKVELPDIEKWKPPFEITNIAQGNMTWPHGNNFGPIGQYSIPQFLEGGITAQVCAVFVDDYQLDIALKRSLDMIWCMHKEVADNDNFELITSVADIHRVKSEGKCGGILALEGFEPVGYDLRFLDIFYKLGLRIGGIAHNRRNYFADGTQYETKTGGLTEMGKKAIERMNEIGIVVDLSHLNQVGFWDALEVTKAPVVLSHRSPKKFFPLKREESRLNKVYDVSRGKERLEALAKNGGVFGVFFLWARDVDDVVEDIEYVIDLIGPDHVGLGSDLYGMNDTGLGSDLYGSNGTTPKGLEDISKIPAITEKLIKRGHSDDVILKILGGNFMRIFEQVWKG